MRKKNFSTYFVKTSIIFGIKGEREMSEITFDKTEYESEKEMWEDITSLIKILTRAGYVMKFWCDEKSLGIYCLEFDYADPALAKKKLIWEDIE